MPKKKVNKADKLYTSDVYVNVTTACHADARCVRITWDFDNILHVYKFTNTYKFIKLYQI